METTKLDESETTTISYQKYAESESPNKLTTVLTDKLPDADSSLFLGAFGFIFDKEKKILLTNLKKRGWDLPGGKTEENERKNPNILEALTETLKRECLEETSVKIKEIQLIAFRKIEKPPENRTARMPQPVAYMVYFIGKVDEILDFKSEGQENGAIDRGFFTREEAEKIEKVYAGHQTIFIKAFKLI